MQYRREAFCLNRQNSKVMINLMSEKKKKDGMILIHLKAFPNCFRSLTQFLIFFWWILFWSRSFWFPTIPSHHHSNLSLSFSFSSQIDCHWSFGEDILAQIETKTIGIGESNQKNRNITFHFAKWTACMCVCVCVCAVCAVCSQLDFIIEIWIEMW